MSTCVFGRGQVLNWQRPSDAIWHHKTGSTLVQVMACLTCHYLNQCWPSNIVTWSWWWPLSKPMLTYHHLWSVTFVLFIISLIRSRLTDVIAHPNLGYMYHCCWLYHITQYFIELTHWGRDEMGNISQMTFSNIFSSIKMFKFQLTFHWSLFLRVQLTIFQHWFR